MMGKGRRQDKLLPLLVVLALVVLLTMMVATVLLSSASSGAMYHDVPFSLASLISDTGGEGDAASLADFVNPAFLGIAPMPEGMGISVGDNVSAELYRMLSPWLALGLSREGAMDTEEGWETALSDSHGVFIRYHSPLPLSVLREAAVESSGLTVPDMGKSMDVAPVREVVLVLPEEDSSSCQILVRDILGQVWRYICIGRGEFPGFATVSAFADSFGSSFFRVTLRKCSDGTREPVFLERLRVRNILLSSGTAGMIQENRMDEYRHLLRQFDFNPDKLSTHEEGDGTQVTVESHGVFRSSEERFTYTATSSGGVSLQHLVGYREEYTLSDSLRAACAILEGLRSNYLAGDGEMFLTEVSRQKDMVRIVFRYTFDNLLLDGCDPAMVVEIRDDRVVYAEIYAIALRSLGNFDSSYLESGFTAALADEGCTDVTLTYPVDFTSSSIYPVWTFYRTMETEETTE